MYKRQYGTSQIQGMDKLADYLVNHFTKKRFYTTGEVQEAVYNTFGQIDEDVLRKALAFFCDKSSFTEFYSPQSSDAGFDYDNLKYDLTWTMGFIAADEGARASFNAADSWLDLTGVGDSTIDAVIEFISGIFEIFMQ
jgi:hypothetical protein